MDQRVRPEFLAERATIDAEYARGLALITIGVIQNGLEQRPLYLAHDEIVQVAGAIAVEVFKILIESIFGVLVQWFALLGRLE